MTLAPPIGQDSFSAGMCRGAPHLLPKNGAWEIQNGLLNHEGSIYRRGGTALKSNADFGGTNGLRFIWDGILGGGKRTVFASSAVFGTLAADDVTPFQFAATGLTAPLRPQVIDGLLFVGTQAYGGSRKSANYTTGTLTATNGSTAIVGAGTAFLANVDAGMVVTINNRLHAVASVTDDTHLVLFKAYTGTTGAGIASAFSPLPTIPATYGGAGATMWSVVANRLCVCIGNKVFMSAAGDSTSWTVTDFHELPDGTVCLGAESLGDTLFVFTTTGMWALGNMAYNLTDAVGNAQHSQQQLNADLLLWSNPGIASWQNSLVIPAQDGVWLMAPDGSPAKLSLSLDPYYRTYVDAGYQCGNAAVYNSHLVLPIVDSTGAVQDLLVCRLDRPTKTSVGQVFPWSHFIGSGGNVSGVAVRAAQSGFAAPTLLGAFRGTSGRVLTMPAFVETGATADHDASAIAFLVTSRDYPTGSGGANFVKKARARYEMASTATTGVIHALYGSGNRGSSAVWGTFKWGTGRWTNANSVGFTDTTSGDGPESDGDAMFVWRIDRRMRFMRLQLTSSSAVSRLVLRSIDFIVRPSGRN